MRSTTRTTRTTKKSTVWTGSGTKLVTRSKYRVNTVSEIMLGRRREISGREINAWDACLMQRAEAYQNLPTGYRVLCTCIYKQSRHSWTICTFFPCRWKQNIPCPLLFASSSKWDKFYPASNYILECSMRCCGFTSKSWIDRENLHVSDARVSSGRVSSS